MGFIRLRGVWMIKIGVFSQIAQVTIRTLRHYDEVGLLKPVFTEPVTNYRYYTLEQLPRLTRILALKEMGLSLDQIFLMVSQDLSTAQLREMLCAKQEEISKQIEQSHQQLSQIESRLWQIEQEGIPSSYEVILKSVPALTVISVREIIPTLGEMVVTRCRMFKDLHAWLEKNSIAVKQELAFYHIREFVDHNFDFEAAVIINNADFRDSITMDLEGISIYEIPSEGLVASIIHSGVFMQVSHALYELFKWITYHQYSPSGPIREIHWFGQENNLVDANAIVVELQIPIVKNRVLDSPVTLDINI
jgi:DNA-binding transcriptional MerR regulator